MDEKTPGTEEPQAMPESQDGASVEVTEGTAEIIASDGTPEVITAETVTTEQPAAVVEAGAAEVVASDGAEVAVAAAAAEPAVVETQATTVTVQDAPEAGQPPVATASTAATATPSAAPAPEAGAAVPPPPPAAGTAAAVPAPPAPPTAATQPSPTGALVCGVLAIVFSGLPIVGIILGIVAIVLAGKYFKAGGVAGTGKAGRICGIVGIVLSVVWFVAAIAVSCMAFTMIDDYDTNSRYTGSSLSSSSSSSTMTTAAEDAQEAIEMRLDQIKNHDPEMMADLAAVAEKSFERTFSTGGQTLTMQDCGIDPNEYISLMTEGFDYKFDSYDEYGSSADLTYYLTVRDITQITSLINETLDEDAIATMSTAELRTYLGNTIMDAVRSADMTHYGLFDIDLDDEDGVWVIDEDDWDFEMRYFFAIE